MAPGVHHMLDTTSWISIELYAAFCFTVKILINTICTLHSKWKSKISTSKAKANYQKCSYSNAKINGMLWKRTHSFEFICAYWFRHSCNHQRYKRKLDTPNPFERTNNWYCTYAVISVNEIMNVPATHIRMRMSRKSLPKIFKRCKFKFIYTIWS